MSSVEALGFVIIGKTDENYRSVAFSGEGGGSVDMGGVLCGFLCRTLVALNKLNVIAELFQLVISVIHLGGVYLGGACALMPRELRKVADDRNLALFLERQDAVVLEQHHGLTRDLPCKRLIVGVVVFVAGLCAVGSFLYKIQNIERSLVDHGFIKLTALDGLDYLLCARACGGGHLEIVAVLEAEHSVVDRAPVADHHAVEAPLVTEDLYLSVLILGAVSAVYLVV